MLAAYRHKRHAEGGLLYRIIIRILGGLLVVSSPVHAGGDLRDLPFLSGVNASGAEFVTNWRYPDKENIDYYLSQGMRLIRLPIAWVRVQPELGGELDKDHLRELDRILTQVAEADAWLVIDLHDYMRRNGQVVGAPGAPADAAHLADFWRRMALRYGNHPQVIFNLMNEPHDMPSALNLANQNHAIAAIRATGADNIVLVSGNHYSGAHSFLWSDNPAWMAQVEDKADNFAFDLHQYLDEGSRGISPFCIPGSGATALVAATDWLRANDRQALLGEFNAGPGERCAAELRDLLAHVAANDDVWIGWAYWAGGGLWRGANPTDPFTLDPSLTGTIPQMEVLRPFIKSKE